MTDTDTITETLVLNALERDVWTLRQLQRTIRVPMRQLRVALNAMARHGKVRVRHGFTGTEVIPIGNN